MPRKSNVSVQSPDEASSSSKAAAKEAKEDGINVEDLNLPKSITQRLAKGMLPPNTQIQKDAVLAMSKSATVFVNYITSQAAENAARNNKKTVNPTDVYDAMQELEFGDFLPKLMAEVAKFTSIQADKRNSYRKKVREGRKSGVGAAEEAGEMQGKEEEGEGEEGRKAKRAKVDVGGGGEDEEEEGEEEGDEAVDVVDEEEDEEVEDDVVEEEEEEGEEEEGLAEDPLEAREEDEGDESEGSNQSD